MLVHWWKSWLEHVHLWHWRHVVACRRRHAERIGAHHRINAHAWYRLASVGLVDQVLQKRVRPVKREKIVACRIVAGHSRRSGAVQIETEQVILI